MSQELLRIVDNIARDKNIDKESIFVDLEEAMVSAARKHFGDIESDIVVSIDRSTGRISAFKDDVENAAGLPGLHHVYVEFAEDARVQGQCVGKGASALYRFGQFANRFLEGRILFLSFEHMQPAQ